MPLTSVFANAGVNIDHGKLVDSFPSHNEICNLIQANATNTMLLTRESIGVDPCIYISVDKGGKKVIKTWLNLSVGTTKKQKK